MNHLKTIKKKMEKIGDSIKSFLALNVPLFGNKNLELAKCESGACFSEGCNITNLPDVYETIVEKSKKMESLIQKLLNRINARIYKTEDIKIKWDKIYAGLTEQDPVKIDYTVYPNSDVATERIFNDIFVNQKIGDKKLLNPSVNQFNYF